MLAKGHQVEIEGVWEPRAAVGMSVTRYMIFRSDPLKMRLVVRAPVGLGVFLGWKGQMNQAN